MSFGYELISETDRLQEFPELGRIVPEYRNDDVREIIFGPIESCTESFTTKSFARLHASGIPREEFQNCKSGHPRKVVTTYYLQEQADCWATVFLSEVIPAIYPLLATACSLRWLPSIARDDL